MDTQKGILYGSDRFLRMLLQVSFIVLWTEQLFTGFYTGFLYGHGIQSILLCVLTIALALPLPLPPTILWL
jgi:hypothetical protein